MSSQCSVLTSSAFTLLWGIPRDWALHSLIRPSPGIGVGRFFLFPVGNSFSMYSVVWLPLSCLQALDEATLSELKTVLQSFLSKSQVLKLEVKVGFSSRMAFALRLNLRKALSITFCLADKVFRMQFSFLGAPALHSWDVSPFFNYVS